MAARAWGALLAFAAAILFTASLISPTLWTDGPAWWDGHPTVDGRELQGKDAHISLFGSMGCDGHGCQAIPRDSLSETLAMVELGASGLAIVLALALAIAAMRESDKRKTIAGLAIGATVVVGAGAGALVYLGPGIQT